MGQDQVVTLGLVLPPCQHLIIVDLALGLVLFDLQVVLPVLLDWWVVHDLVPRPGLVLLLVLTVRPGSAQYCRIKTAGSSNSEVTKVDIAFGATEDLGHGLVPPCRASLLAVPSNLPASLAVSHVKYTSSSPDVSAVNFVVPTLPGLPAPVTLRCLLLFFFPMALQFLLFKH